MKKYVPMSVVISACALIAMPASATDGAEWCQGFTQASGISDEPCPCVIEAVEADSELAAELYSFATKDEYDANASEELKSTLSACVGE